MVFNFSRSTAGCQGVMLQHKFAALTLAYSGLIFFKVLDQRF